MLWPSEIINLKDKIHLLESKLDERNNRDVLIENEIDEIDNQIENLNKSMLTLYDEWYNFFKKTA